MGYLKKCGECNTYTMKGHCPQCDAETSDPEPPKFSYPDKYGEYRRKTKQEMRSQDGNADQDETEE